jgi:hypothetical protein
MFIHLIVVINFGWCFQNCRSSYVQTKQENIFLSSRHRCDFWRKTIEGLRLIYINLVYKKIEFDWYLFSQNSLLIKKKMYVVESENLDEVTNLNFRQKTLKYLISVEMIKSDLNCKKIKRLFCENKYQSNSIFL